MKTTIQEKQTYNGWANYQTWVTKLWLDNEQSTSEYWAERAREIFDASKADNVFSKSENARGELSKALQGEIGKSTPDLKATLWSDLLNSAMGQIDWYEIAEAFLEDNCTNYKGEN